MSLQDATVLAQVGVLLALVDVVLTIYCQSGISADLVRVFHMQALLGVILIIKSSTFIRSESDF